MNSKFSFMKFIPDRVYPRMVSIDIKLISLNPNGIFIFSIWANNSNKKYRKHKRHKTAIYPKNSHKMKISMCNTFRKDGRKSNNSSMKSIKLSCPSKPSTNRRSQTRIAFSALISFKSKIQSLNRPKLKRHNSRSRSLMTVLHVQPPT
jgi:hypothetical protein